MSDFDMIKRSLKIDAFENITNEQMIDLIKLYANGKASIAQLEQIAAMIPNFAAVAIKAANAIAQSATVAGSSQQIALVEVGKTRDAIFSLASHPSITADILKLIIEKLGELSKQIERMNNSNSSFFSTTISDLAVLSLAVLSVIGAGMIVDRKS